VLLVTVGLNAEDHARRACTCVEIDYANECEFNIRVGDLPFPHQCIFMRPSSSTGMWFKIEMFQTLDIPWVAVSAVKDLPKKTKCNTVFTSISKVVDISVRICETSGKYDPVLNNCQHFIRNVIAQLELPPMSRNTLKFYVATRQCFRRNSKTSPLPRPEDFWYRKPEKCSNSR
jgi:hypothetical protein